MTSSGSRLHASDPTVTALELAGLVASSRRLGSLIGNWSGQFPFDAYRLSVPADDPLYRARRLLTKAHERPDDRGDTKLRGLLEAGDPKGEVRLTWHAKEVVRSLYDIADPEVADEFVAQLAVDLQDDSCPPEVRQLGRTIRRWHTQIVAWHHARVSNGPTEATNNLIKRIKRVSASGSASSPTTESASCSTPAAPTGAVLPTVTPR
jgi:hypothetical protein